MGDQLSLTCLSLPGCHAGVVCPSSAERDCLWSGRGHEHFAPEWAAPGGPPRALKPDSSPHPSYLLLLGCGPCLCQVLSCFLSFAATAVAWTLGNGGLWDVEEAVLQILPDGAPCSELGLRPQAPCGQRCDLPAVQVGRSSTCHLHVCVLICVRVCMHVWVHTCARVCVFQCGSRAGWSVLSFSPEICGECPSGPLGSQLSLRGQNAEQMGAATPGPSLGRYVSSALGPAHLCNEKNMWLLMGNNFWLPGRLFCFVYFSIKYSFKNITSLLSVL